jgi:hypothetical protein
MRSTLGLVLAASTLFSATLALAAPGSLWEIGMEMEGMPFAMPKQQVCNPKDSKEPPVSKDDDECRILEKKQTGNRFRWKAECKEGVMTGDITSTPNSYSGSMKMTDKAGETVAMKIAGKRLGDCDYKDRSGEVRGMLKQSESRMADFCQNALDNMQGSLLGSQCPKEKAVFCQRLATPEGYDKATRHLPAEMLDDATLGAQSITRECKLNNAKLLPRLCASAAADSNLAFVSRLCPAERPRLCAKAASADRLDYVGAHCPAEKAALIKEHCEGRKYSSDIEPRFASFCANAAQSGEVAQSVAGETASPKPEAAESAEAQAVDKVQKGIKQLRGLFGF